MEALAELYPRAVDTGSDATYAWMIAALQLAAARDAELDEEERVRLLTEAQRAAALLDVPYELARAAQLRVKSLRKLGRAAEAHAVATRVVDRYPDLHYRAMLLVEVAFDAIDLGLLDDALRRLDEAEAAIPPGDAAFDRTRRNVAWLRGRAYRDLGLPDRARPFVERHYELARELRANGSRAKDIATAYVNAVSALKLAQGDYDGTLAMVEELLSDTELFYAYPDKRGHLLSIAGMAHLRGALPEADTDAAKAELRAALSVALSTAVELRTRMRLAEAELLAGDADAAAAELERAHGVVERLRAKPDRFAYAEELSDLVALESRVALARGAPAEELRSLRERCAASLDQLVERWERAPRRAGGTAFLHYSTRRAIVGELCRLEIELEGEERGVERALGHLLRVHALSSLTRGSRIGPQDAQRLRGELLGDSRGLLVYLPARGVSHVFALGPARAAYAPLPTADGLVVPRRDWVSHLIAYANDVPASDRDWIVERERELAHAVADVFLPAEIRDEIRSWSAITIVGGDELGVLPFEWLPFEGERFLGESRAVDYLPSLALGLLLARRGRLASTAADLVLVGGVASPAVEARHGLSALELDAARAARFSDPYARTRTLEGGAATLAALRAELAGGARVLQFLVHGLLDFDDERPARLVLAPGSADDGLIDYADAATLPAADFVLLTACSSGVAPSRMGDAGAADLGGAFLGGGASAVLVSQVELRYDDVTGLLAPLHEALADGAPPAEALRRARGELVAADAEVAPFRCGLVGVVGLGQVPVFPADPPLESSRWGLALALGVGVLLGAAAARVARRR